MWTYVNGKRNDLPPGRADQTLLEYLREDLQLTGAKLGCGEGGCGACTVMVSRRDPRDAGKVQHRSINACLAPVYSVAGCHVITVEGIGSTKRGLHPVQARLAKAHGSQCGFCTPGFVMSMYSLLRSKHGAAISEEEIEENLAGNLCRCTGYRPILDAFRPFASAYSRGNMEGVSATEVGGHTGSGSSICPSTGRPCDCKARAATNNYTKTHGCGKHAEDTCQGSRDAERELITPPEVLEHVPTDVFDVGATANWYRPVTLDALLKWRAELPEGKLVAGNTEVGIEMKFKHAAYRDLIYVGWVPELAEVAVEDSSVSFGAGVSLSTLMETCRSLASVDGKANSDSKASSSPFSAFAEQLKWFAGPPIRNWGTIGGNVVTASPISDLNPLWMAAGATFTVQSWARGVREVPATAFFLGYRKVDMKPDEVLVRVRLPRSVPFEYVKEFKQAQRRDDDIAIVNCGFRAAFRFDEGSSTWVIDDACIAFGGVAPVTVLATEAAEVLRGKSLTDELVEAALAAAAREIIIPDDAPGGRPVFRRMLVAAFMRKGLAHASKALEQDSSSTQTPYVSRLGAATAQLAESFHREPSKGIQYYSITGLDDIVGSPAQHASAELQVSGEARYVDDMPRPGNMLHLALVLSERAHAIIKSIDCTEARAMPGVEAIHFAADVPGKNSIGPVLKDEEVFAASTVTCVGQTIGVVTATTRAQALRAARAVRVAYEDLEPVLTIQDAIAKKSFYGDEWGSPIDCGDVDAAFAEEDLIVVEESIDMGGQEHFYLEPNAHVVVPVESGELVSYSSTQCPQKHQQYIASVLGISSNRVVVRTKRIGGGFGGKETRAAFLNTIAAIPALLLDKPVSLVVDRDVDMGITGHRHPFFANYKAACTKDGVIRAIDVQLYSNGGNSLDLSGAVMDRALLSLDSVYHIPNVRARGTVCRTNVPSNTAFRGFGAPQGMMVIESIVERLAAAAGIDQRDFVERNMIRTGNRTHYGQIIEDCQAKKCWDDALESAGDCGGLEARRRAVDEFNASHANRKRGLAVTPTKFGISFTLKFLNQAGALVHIYQGDGAVLVSHGGVEMGQGLHTKVCQIVAQALGVPLETVHISETATDKVPNATPTAASASSDLYGGAAADACAQLNARLAPYRAAHPDASFLDIVQKAYFDRVDLSAHGFYATPDITSHPMKGDEPPRPFNYFTYGTAVTEVELDVTTGDWHAIRSDVVMDVGQSLNPAIDIGQVEGAFVQGMGWACLEELTWGDDNHPWVRTKGSLFSCGPGTYKIPTANDIPIDFRVSLLRNSHCHRTPLAHSSKAVGEPPFFLGTSVFWALKDAVKAYRLQERGLSTWFRLDLPATGERLVAACNASNEVSPGDHRS